MSTELCSGYLHKLGEVNKAWKDRWFVLERPKDGGAKLYYFRARGQKNPQGTVNVENAYTQPSGDPLHPLGFDVVTPQRTYQLTAATQKEMDKWVAELTKVSAVSEDNEMFHKLEELTSSAETRKLLADIDARSPQSPRSPSASD